MPNDSSAIVSKVWNYAHVLKNAGVGYRRRVGGPGDYVEQITYLLFLKLAPPSPRLRRAGSEMTELGFDPSSSKDYAGTGNPIPQEFGWSELRGKGGDERSPLKKSDLGDFVACCQGRDARPAGPKSLPKATKSADRAGPPYHGKRKETERFKKFTYDEIIARDKANLDIFWLKDESLEDSENLPPPAELAAEIVVSLEAALEEFRAVEEALMPASGGSGE